MKVLVTGANGQLGYEVINELKKRSIKCIAADREEFDITDFLATQNFIMNCSPDAVIHCGAYTMVEQAEDKSDLCYQVNVIGSENIAKCCKAIKAKMIYISTDYVFDGQKDGYYEVDDTPNPLNIYGKSKLLGELAVKNILNEYFIVRISWGFGVNGNNFVKTMLKLAKERQEICVVRDQIGSPTYMVDLAKLLVDMVKTENYGVYHATNEGECSWATFAEEIFRIARLNVKVHHIKSTDYPTKAQRPLNSKMSKRALTAAGFQSLPGWEDALRRYICNGVDL